eukprot:Skav223010  [mRNA]  locus=scaffold1422:40071:41220:+ [translate_table: standard]
MRLTVVTHTKQHSQHENTQHQLDVHNDLELHPMLAARQKVAIPFYARRRQIFDTPEYYTRVFGELKRGEILEWYNIDWEELEPVLMSFFQSKPRRILDIGCGTSRLPAQLATRQLARLVVGHDISPEAIAQQKAE